MSKEKTTQLVIDFSNAVNNYNFELPTFLKQFSMEHRTLQQKMFNVMLSTIVEVASDDYRTDGRNEYSKKTAKMLIRGYADQVKEEYLEQNSGHGDEYYERKAEEIKQGVINNPEKYLSMPLI